MERGDTQNRYQINRVEHPDGQIEFSHPELSSGQAFRRRPMRPTMAQLEASGIRGIKVLIFYGILEMMNEAEDGRTAAAARYLAERFEVSERAVRQAIAAFVSTGWIQSSTRARRYTLLSRGPRLTSGAQNGAQNGAQKSTKKRAESIDHGAQNGATGVTAVRSSSAVDVSRALSLSVRATAARATPSVDKSPRATAPPRRRRRQEDYEAAIARAPQLPEALLYIDRLYADLSGGHKYPWTQHPYAATILADLIGSHGLPVVLAAADRFFVKGDPWIERRAWAIDEFGRLFAGLIAKDGIAKRTAQIDAEIKITLIPNTPKQLRAQIDEMRRRQLDDILGWRVRELAVL